MLKDEIDPKYTTLYLTESANQVLFRGRRVSHACPHGTG